MNYLIRKFYLNVLKISGFFEIIYSFIFAKKSNTEVDVIITLHHKDKEKLANCIWGIKINLLHKINSIFIITDKFEEKINYVHNLKCEYINEKELLKISKKDINYKSHNIDRSGWLLQQLLNYQAVISLGDSEHKFAINADTILSRKQIFVKKNKIVFNACDDYQIDYFDIAKKLLDLPKLSFLSFTSHHMLYRRSIMKEMLTKIEEKFKTTWPEAILNNVNKKLHSCHSDFETYAQYHYNYYKNDMKVEYWFNKSIFKKDKIKNYFNHFYYKSLSFHSWAENR
tara:strand:- start:881 stop:1732 length:852 start_codon:yes stop_codon:yes gene_type:complete